MVGWECRLRYTNAQGVAIDGDDAHLGRFNIGPEFSYRYTAASGIATEPRFGAGFVELYTSAGDGLDSATRASVKDTPLDSFQMRFIGGLKIELPEGTRVELEGSYTGLGQQGYETVSGKIGLTIPLQ